MNNVKTIRVTTTTGKSIDIHILQAENSEVYSAKISDIAFPDQSFDTAHDAFEAALISIKGTLAKHDNFCSATSVEADDEVLDHTSIRNIMQMMSE